MTLGPDHARLNPSSNPPGARRLGLRVRFVTRVSDEVNEAIRRAARAEGITAGAWVRRTVLERLELRSERDERSGRPRTPTDAELADLATAIRELAGVSAAVSLRDWSLAKDRLAVARALLIPLAVRRSGR